MKTCSKDGCDYPSFSKGYCRRHQYLRVDKSVPTLRKSRVAPKKYLKNPKQTGEKEVFERVWNNRPHKSQLSGKKIYDARPGNFAHLWPKGKYPEFRLLDINICLLTLEEHFLFDQGTEEQRKKYADENNCDWEVIEILKQAVLS